MITRTVLDVTFTRTLPDFWDVTPCHYGPTWEERDAAFFIG